MALILPKLPLQLRGFVRNSNLYSPPYFFTSITISILPSGYVLAGNGSIPYWTGTDPKTRTSELFNTVQTPLQIYAIDPKLPFPRLDHRRRDHLGGETVGDLAGALILVSDPLGHAGWPSDSSAMYSQAGTTSPPPISYTTNTTAPRNRPIPME
ncbi:hypothetical protein BDN67DRAFT_528060 [Paxillus ammoniavirescens]|nr:hypothetical protein BDN67DRAFT_528060 [Paxillus ammoniavirescens]